MRTLAAVVGLPRYSEIYPRLIGSLKYAGANAVIAHFWDYIDTEVPETNRSLSNLPRNLEDWQSINHSGFSKVYQSEPLPPLKLTFDPNAHPQVRQLGLKPNYMASKSWLTAISLGAEDLKSKDPDLTSDFWMILRPDILLSRRSLKRMLKMLGKSSNFTDTSVAVAARPRAHRVLKLAGVSKNLPVDHFFIGRPKAIIRLVELREMLCQVELERDLRQPLCNEFLIGQALEDAGLSEYPVRLPYVIWRGSLVSSLTAFGAKSKLDKFRSLCNNASWQVRSYLMPGHHPRGI